MLVIIEKSDLFSSPQDFGRRGYEHDGIIPCGALDTLVHEIANRLVANDKNEAALEMTNKVATIRFTEPILIALARGDVKAYTEQMTISPYKLYLLDRGDVLKFRGTSYTPRVYLVAGDGFELDTWLESNPTDFNVKIGGFRGRTLQGGDEIRLKRDYTARHHKLFGNPAHTKQADWGIDRCTLPFNYMPDVFHVVKNKGMEDFKRDAIQRFVKHSYKITSKVNHMGVILKGEKIKTFYEDMPPYQAAKKGAIQTKRDGTPIILLNDCHTLGDYPQIDTITGYYLAKLAQKPQGSRSRFRFIDILTAKKNLVRYSSWLDRLFHEMEYRMQLEMME